MNGIPEYREMGRGVFYWPDRLFILAVAGVFWGITNLFCRITVRGRENIPKEGRILFLLNHPSYLGIFATIFAVFWPWVLGKRMDMIPINVGKTKYTNVPLWSWVLRHLNVMALPAKGNGEIRSQIVRRQVWILTKLQNCALFLFPEGTRTEVGQHLGAFRPGVGRIVAEARPRIVFVYDRGSEKAWSKDRKLPCLPIAWWHGVPYPRRFPVTIDISKPISSINGSLTRLSQVCGSVSLEESGQPVASYIRDLFWSFIVARHPVLLAVEPVNPCVHYYDRSLLL